MAIIASHALLYSSEPEALRATLRDVFGFDHVDAGGGWLIFALPPAELGVHPGDAPSHALSFMCDDIVATIADLRAKGIEFSGEPQEQRFGIVTEMILPGDVRVQLYQPHHPIAAKI
jgi:catechol 2,3-dioxygenase-like lactoylglutathione lyase family enzyme